MHTRLSGSGCANLNKQIHVNIDQHLLPSASSLSLCASSVSARPDTMYGVICSQIAFNCQITSYYPPIHPASSLPAGWAERTPTHPYFLSGGHPSRHNRLGCASQLPHRSCDELVRSIHPQPLQETAREPSYLRSTNVWIICIRTPRSASGPQPCILVGVVLFTVGNWCTPISATYSRTWVAAMCQSCLIAQLSVSTCSLTSPSALGWRLSFRPMAYHLDSSRYPSMALWINTTRRRLWREPVESHVRLTLPTLMSSIGHLIIRPA